MTEQISRDEIDRVTRAAMFSVDTFVMDNWDELAGCTSASRSRLTVKAAIAYLASTGLITIAPNEDRMIPLDLAEPHASNLLSDLYDAVREKHRIDGALPR